MAKGYWLSRTAQTHNEASFQVIIPLPQSLRKWRRHQYTVKGAGDPETLE